MPAVSVILSTFNWPSVLRYAIRTVLWQTFADFELLVIGDCCTDNTAEVVASFSDPRIRWHNLPQNSGNQSGPNNVGLEMARGEFIAYMHQDDLWLPNHLALLVQALQAHESPLAHTLALQVSPRPDEFRWLLGLPNSGAFGPDKVPLTTPSVMHRRDIARQVGGWREWSELYETPPRDLWKRILGSQQAPISVAEVTLVRFNSAERKNSYIEQPCHEQAEYFARIQSEPDFLYRELVRVLYTQARGIRPKRVIPSKPVDARPGWEIDQYRQMRGLGATSLKAHNSLRPYLRRMMYIAKMPFRRVRAEIKKRL